MKKAIVTLFVVGIILFNACSSSKTGNNVQSFNFDTTVVKAGNSFYQCPMHLKILSDKPGDCPDCGMALEKKSKF